MPFKFYREAFEKHLKVEIPHLCEKNKLGDACEYALLNGGKRVRPIIILLVAKALGFERVPLDACLSVEFFHTASLIADDLPCMDNDDYRRDRPSVHKVFGETVALLASYGLITAGFEMIHQSAREFSAEIGMVALKCATKGSGFSGATGGQFLDLFPKGQSLEDIREVIEKKTVTLFEVAFVFGWLFGGGDLALLETVKRASYHFGWAFQVADDLDDFRRDEEREDSSNLAICLGKDQASFLLEGKIREFESEMKKLQIFNPEFQQLSNMFASKLEQAPAL